jgi:hypothetical protein
MSYSERVLFELIKKANPGFNQSKSSLAPLLVAMEKPRGVQVVAMRTAVSQMPADKKTKYQNALAYLEREYAGDWLGVPPPPAPRGLRTETKVGWREARLPLDTVLVHCTGTAPSLLMASGADPQYSSEWCVPSEPNAPIWEWNRFVFLFQLDADNFPPKKAEQFGFASKTGYIYVARIPARTTYMSQNGTIGPNKEIAFPELVKASCMIGIFQCVTGDQETPPRKKTEYTLTSLALQSPYDVQNTVQGSNTVDSPNSAGLEVKRLLGLP